MALGCSKRMHRRSEDVHPPAPACVPVEPAEEWTPQPHPGPWALAPTETLAPSFLFLPRPAISRVGDLVPGRDNRWPEGQEEARPGWLQEDSALLFKWKQAGHMGCPRLPCEGMAWLPSCALPSVEVAGVGGGGRGALKHFNCGEKALDWYPDSTLKKPSDFEGLNL